MRLLLLSVVALTLLAQPAHAGFVAGWLVAIGLSAGAAAVVATALVNLAISATSLLLQKRKQKKQREAGIRTTFVASGGTDPQGTIVGLYATAGHILYKNGALANNNLQNQIIELSDLPGLSLRRVVIDGVVSELDGLPADGKPVNGVRYPVLAKRDPTNGDDYCSIRFYDGTQTTADPDMVSLFGSDGTRPWTSDHILTGICYAVVQSWFSQIRFTGEPNIRFELVGIPLYDPRRDSSVGGSGPHRFADQTTWEPTTNFAVIAYNILRGIPLVTGEIWGGEAEAEDLPLDSWVPGMNVADIEVGDPPRPQYQAGFEIRFEDEPGDVLEEILASGNAQVAELGGVWRIQVGPPAASVAHMTDDDMLVSKPSQRDPFPGLEATYNAITVSYTSPGALWKGSSPETLLNAEWEAADGQRRLFDLKLPAVFDAGQARQVAQNLIRDERRFVSHGNTLVPEFFRLEPLFSLTWTSARNSYDAKLFEIVEAAYDLRTLQIGVRLRERDPDDFTHDPGLELPDAPQVTSPVPIIDAGVPGFAVAPHTDLNGAGGAARPGIRAVWDKTIADTVEGLSFQVRVVGQTDLTWSGPVVDVESGTFALVPLQRDTEHQMRVRAIARNRDTYWSLWQTVRTPDVGLSPADLSDETWTAISDDARSIANELIEPVEARIDRDLELQDIEQISTARAVGVINERILWLLSKTSETDKKLRDAGIYIDPETGQVGISAFDYQEGRISETEIRLDAADANINLRATTAWVNQQISNAVLDPSQVPIVDDLNIRISNVEIDLDAFENAILLKADNTAVSGMDVRLTGAEVDIIGLEALITLKAEQADFSALEARTTAAETTLNAIDGASIRQTVADSRALLDAAGLNSASDLAALLQSIKDRKVIRKDISYATQDIRAKVDEDREATAAITFALGAAIDGSLALIEKETSLRVAENEVQAGDTTALKVRIDAVETAASEQADAQDGQADAITILTVEVSNNAGTTNALADALIDLMSTVGANSTTISQQATTIDGIQGEITWRINNNGHITGVVLRSEINDMGVPASAFAVLADKFAIVGPGDSEVSPFVVYATPQVIDGISIPAGTYIDKAFIRRASVGTLEIAGNAITGTVRVFSTPFPSVISVNQAVTPVDIIQLAMDRVSGYATDLSFSANWVAKSGSLLASPQARLMRSTDNGAFWTEVRVYSLGVGDISGFELGSFNTVDFNTGGGATLYKITAEVPADANAPKGLFDLFRVYLSATQFKR